MLDLFIYLTAATHLKGFPVVLCIVLFYVQASLIKCFMEFKFSKSIQVSWNKRSGFWSNYWSSIQRILTTLNDSWVWLDWFPDHSVFMLYIYS